MKKICPIIILCLAMMSLASANSNQSCTSDLVTDVIIVHDLPSSQRPRMPEPDPLVFYCCVVEPTNTLYLSSNQSVFADVKIENITTGDYNEYATQISELPIELYTLGTGEYHICILLSTDNTYSGYFEID